MAPRRTWIHFPRNSQGVSNGFQPGFFPLVHNILIEASWNVLTSRTLKLETAMMEVPLALQNVVPSALSFLELRDSRVTVLHADFQGTKSPCECAAVQWQYFDLELNPNSMSHSPPAVMSTVIYV